MSQPGTRALRLRTVTAGDYDAKVADGGFESHRPGGMQAESDEQRLVRRWTA